MNQQRLKNRLRKNSKSLLAVSLFVATFYSLLSALPLTHAITQPGTVEVSVPSTVARFQGLAAPNALVSIMKAGSNVATASADAAGQFVVDVVDSSGIQNYSLYYEDVSGLRSSRVERLVSLQPQQTTPFSVFLSPTLTSVIGSVIPLGTDIPMQGVSVPNSQVEILVNGGVKRYQGTTNQAGVYNIAVSSSDLTAGTYTLQARSLLGADASELSEAYEVVLVALPEIPPPDIRTRPEQLPPPVVVLPVSGTEIIGDRVLLQGDALPFAQITIFVDGVAYGATAADQTGRWSYLFVAQRTPVVLTFSACIAERCSVLSDRLELSFVFIIEPCELDFQLQSYRFWQFFDGVPQVLSSVSELDPKATITVDWGDGRVATYTPEQAVLGIETEYAEPGLYEGTITYQTSDCAVERNFSIYETAKKQRNDWWALSTLVLLLLSLYALNHKTKKKLGQGNRT